MTNERRKQPQGARTPARLSAGFVVLVILVAGMGVTQAHVSVVTGHSVFVNADGYDQCLASIAGILRFRIMWFNDQILVDRYDGPGNYIYATEEGAPDPRGKKLVSSGTTYDFVDPNGAKWLVEEAYWDEDIQTGHGSSTNTDTGTGWHDPRTGDEIHANAGTVRYYTWIVQVGKPVQDIYNGGHPHDYYNFVTLIDTCKMNRNRDGLAYHNQSNPDDPDYQTSGHPLNETRDHVHETYFVNLYVGKEPRILPVGCIEDLDGGCHEPPNDLSGTVSWSSQWTNSPGGSDDDDNDQIHNGTGTSP